jgi:hypothetical protein
VHVRWTSRWAAMKKKAQQMVPEEEVRQQAERIQKKATAQKKSAAGHVASVGMVADDYIPGVTDGGLIRR